MNNKLVMPPLEEKKTYLEKADPTGLMTFLRFLNSGHYSPLVRSVRYSLLAVCGDSRAEVQARIALAHSKKVSDESLFSLDSTRSLIVNRLNKREWNPRLLDYISGHKDEGVPFCNFDTEPAPVSQLKKIVNALYHAEEALKAVEQLNLEELSLKEGNTLDDAVQTLLGVFSEHVYELSMLTTHPDLELNAFWGEEWKKLSGFLFAIMDKLPQLVSEQVHSLHDNYHVDLKTKEGAAQQFGLWSGTLLEHLRPTREMNYSAVSYFSADISVYLNRLTQLIQNTANTWFSADYLNQEKKKIEEYQISKERLHELNNASVRLAAAFQSLNSGIEALQPLNAYALVGIVRNTVTLVEGIIDESGHFRAGSEALVRSSLAEIKYTVFFELVKTLDKLEDESLMRPGVLSSPVVSALDDFYAAIFSYVNSFVDLSTQGQDLSCLIDSRFIQMRRDALLSRESERGRQWFEHQSRNKMLDEFFGRLKAYRGKRLSKLTPEEKAPLLSLFSIVQPLIAEADLSISNVIAESLLPQERRPQEKTDHEPKSDKKPEETPKGFGFVWREASKFGQVIGEGLSATYAFVEQDVFGYHSDRVEFLDEGYTLALRPAYLSSQMLSSRHLYVSVSDDRVVLTIKKPNELAERKVVTDFPAPRPFSLEKLSEIEGELFKYAREHEALRLPLSLSQKIKHKITKEKTTLDYRALTGKDCRTHILHSAGAFHQHPYPQDQDVYLEATPFSEPTGQNWLSRYTKATITRNKFYDAKEAFSAFFTLLESAEKDAVLRRFENKSELRALYFIIQPYLVSSLRTILTGNLSSELDKKIIDALNGRTTRSSELPIKVILDLKVAIQEDFNKREKTFAENLSVIEKEAQKEIQTTPITQLIKENPFGDRKGYLIKDKRYTESVKKLEEHFNHFTNRLFPSSILQKLKPQTPPVADALVNYTFSGETDALPFPEAEPGESLDYFKQEKQVLALKQLYNILYRLKDAAIHVEALNEDHYWVLYVIHVVRFEEQLRKAALLSYELSKDQHFSALANDLLRTCNEIVGALKTLSAPYTPDKLDKDSNREEVRDPIFYMVNGLVIAQKQIDEWQKGAYISEQSAKEANRFAEDVSEKIRKIVESNSYLQWILKTDVFYNLFLDVKARWNQFSASSTKAIEANLESIYTENFTKILIEADQWERKLGLKMGTLSDPIKEVLDAYYSGMVEILSRDAAHHIGLVTTALPLQKRQEAVRQARVSHASDLVQANHDLACIQQMNLLFTENPQKTDEFLKKTLNETDAFAVSYDTALPLLRQVLSNEIARDYIKYKMRGFSDIIPVLLMEKPFVEEHAVLYREALKETLILAEAFFQGEAKTARFSTENVETQERHLRAKNESETQSRQKNIDQIIRKLVTERLSKYKSASKMFFSIRAFYDKMLTDEIEKHTPDFLTHISQKEALEPQVEQFLNEKVTDFDTRYLSDFSQLEQLYQALSELESYLKEQQRQLSSSHSFYKHTWALETHHTLTDKKTLHDELKAILDTEGIVTADDPFGIKKRITDFREKISDPRTATRLLSTENTYKISPLSWLLHWFVNLLSLVGVYKSEAQIIHECFVNRSLQKSDPTPPVVVRKESNGLNAVLTYGMRFFTGKKPDDGDTPSDQHKPNP